jgi:hypothetical protein
MMLHPPTLAHEAAPLRGCLCFFGLVKNVTDRQLASLQRNLIEPLLHVTRTDRIDAYLHTHRMERFNNARNNEANHVIDQDKSIRKLQTLPLNFRAIEIGAPETADADPEFQPLEFFMRNGDPWPENPRTSVRYFLRQLHALDQVANLLQPHADEYDFAVFVRPDLLFLDALDQACVRVVVATSTDERPMIALPSWHSYGGFNDRFAIGRPRAMCAHFCSRKSAIRAYCASGRKPHAETFLGHHLISRGVRVLPMPVRFQRVRANGSTPDSLVVLADSQLRLP